MRGVLFLNDRDVTTDFNFVVHAITGEWPGGLGSASRDVPLIEGPEMQGAILDPGLIRGLPGRATITGRFEGLTFATSKTSMDDLKALLYQDEIRVRTIYAPDRECFATVQSVGGEPYQKRFLNGRTAVSFSFVVPDGLAYRLTPDGVTLEAVFPTLCPMGTAESHTVINIHGDGNPLTNPRIIVKDSSGDTVQEVGFSTASLPGGVLAANQSIIIDSDLTRIDLSTAGIITNGATLWTSGDFVVILKPEYASFETAQWPTMELAAESGDPVGGCDYTRSYR